MAKLAQSIPVIAQQALVAAIPNTPVTVNIPEGTKGRIVDHAKKNQVLVQFDVPTLPALLADKNALQERDNLEVIVETMIEIVRDEETTGGQKQEDADELIIRTLRYLASDKNRKHVEELITCYLKVPRPYKSMKR